MSIKIMGTAVKEGKIFISKKFDIHQPELQLVSDMVLTNKDLHKV